MKRKSFALVVLVSLLSVAVPAMGTTACVAGNLSTIEFSNCTIGSLTFGFNGLTGVNQTYNTTTHSYTYYQAPTASEFFFTPTTNGFTLSFKGGSQSITAPANGNAVESATLNFTIVDPGPGITQAFVSGDSSAFSVSGSNASSFGLDQNHVTNGTNINLSDFNMTYQAFGQVTRYNQYVTGAGVLTFPFDTGSAVAFDLAAYQGDSASWNGADGTFSFGLYNPPPNTGPVPEPASLALFGSGLVGLAGVIRRKLS